MSRREILDPSARPAMPARRQALFTARDMLLTAAATPALSALAAPAPAPPLHVMHGFADHTTVSLWIQGASSQSLKVEVAPEGGKGPLQAHAIHLGPRTDFTETLEVGGLDPGEPHRYAIRADKGGAVLARGTFRTQPLWQWRTDPPTVRIATGSCAYLNDPRFDRPGKPYGGGEEIFDSIAAAAPDLMLWLGDNIYLNESDYTSRHGINRRYRFYRDHPRMQKLWTAAPHVAIWDDHDFGPDNSDASYSGRGWSHEMFLRYWPMPFSPPADGLYGSILQGDVDVLMLDSRSYRYPQHWPAGPDKVLYGAKQMQWLKAALTYSRAPFKLVAGGTQFFNKVSVGGSAESWSRYPAEQADLLKFLEERKIPGVIFLSGDRHFAQQLRVERQGLYPLNEITVSPLTSGPSSSLNDAERANPEMVPGTLYNDRNFALITVSGPRAKRALTLELRDTRGAKVWEWNTTAADLAMGART